MSVCRTLQDIALPEPSSPSRDADKTGSTHPVMQMVRPGTAVSWPRGLLTALIRVRSRTAAKVEAYGPFNSCHCFSHLPLLLSHPAEGGRGSCVGRRPLQEGRDALGRRVHSAGQELLVEIWSDCSLGLLCPRLFAENLPLSFVKET